MRFTVVPAAGVGLLIGQHRDPEPPLAPLGKTRTQDGVITGAVTRDGEWVFERQEDGTWAAGHLLSKTVVRAGLPSLPACQAYVASGAARADLELATKENRGERR